MDMNLKSAVIEDKKNHATGYSILWAWKKFSFLLCLDATTVDSDSNYSPPIPSLFSQQLSVYKHM